MKKFLVVGVGGSGGATLRYMIDELRADLRTHGVDQLPDAWQFVQIDVPPTPEQTPGLGSITDLGGRYVPVSASNAVYGDVRRTVESRLAPHALGALATWEPDSAADGMPVVTGAGQQRGIGRMLTLTRVKQIHEALQQSWEALQRPTAWGVLPQAMPEEGPFKLDQRDLVVPVVVGSMAGGSGASMFLDVCRILGRVGAIDRRYLGTFLYTPDVFHSLDDGAIKGIDGNALGALGDLIAAQMGAGGDADSEIFEAFGLGREASGPPFGRVFPIGSFIGGDGPRFGATADHIFRGLGRAVAATMMSESATEQYLKNKIENPTPLDVSQARFGWGAAKSSDFAWGSFGYATLSLGRDRYAEYVAQRLARTAVDRLIGGFENPSSRLTPEEQLDQLVDSQWDQIRQRLGLRAPDGSPVPWLVGEALTEAQRNTIVDSAVAPFRHWVEQQPAQRAADWLTDVQATLPRFEDAAKETVRNLVRAWADGYVTRLEERTKSEVVRILAHPSQGLPYVRRVLERLRSEVGLLVEALRRARPDLRVLQTGAETQSVAVGLKNTSSDQGQLPRRVADDVRRSGEDYVHRWTARLLADVLAAFGEEVLEELQVAVSRSLETLVFARDQRPRGGGIALLRTTSYQDWPEESDLVPPRFDEAHNEVLLTTSAEFPARFREHVSTGGGVYQSNLEEMVEAVVRGQWENVGAAPADFEVVTNTRGWRPAVLDTDPHGQPTPPSRPAYLLALSTADLLERATAFQARRGVFEKFSSQTFEGFLNEPGISDIERERRRIAFTDKFEETIKQAQPLVGVNGTMVRALHDAELQVELTFSAIPLTPGSAVVEDARRRLETTASRTSVDRFDLAVSPSTSSRRIAVFGGHQFYTPLVFSSFLRQLRDRWAQSGEDRRRELWNWKRSRPIPGGVGMSVIELRTMIKGWYLGRALGLLHHPDDYLSAEAVNVWSTTEQRWLTFETRLLTARHRYRDPQQFDWLAGVLEGHTLAVVNAVDDPDLTSLRPYEALRSLADAGPLPATAAAPVSGQRLLEQWLRTGAWPSGVRSAAILLDGEEAADLDPQARVRAVQQWLASVRRWVVHQWLEPTASFGPTAGYRLRVESAAHLYELPLFAEIALTTYHALADLENLLQAAADSVLAGGSGDAPRI
ncbi:hypothetical protein DJ010_00910 [Nocardioides silvaticus]|uniref:Tubulin-like protein n=1 Tax=Nocardioides silvaticus TaxID=2201891 RepID=A0A316TX83_9ACTN|nr:tubulin-like doman-containing protein [Nocardioides silvaticus]PWN04246.1 hypothetical protein DJ010_00910 [Nocardioides silvaticus]